MVKDCVICGEEESEATRLYELPCWRHWVCKDDIASFFVNATENESLYPPKCCDDIILLQDWVEHVSDHVQVAFQLKEQGEYAVLPKYRVYCANTSCTRFLHPHGHITDPDTEIVYALCEADECGMVTCVGCKSLLAEGIEGHKCEVQENDKKFKEAVEEQGYKECFLCGRTVELAEACNHITCECGNNFCYICGKEYTGMHGCPQYGPAHYDEEGYNQDGYHRDTGLNRDGRTRRQQMLHDQGAHDEEDDGREDVEDEEDPDEDVLQHVDAETRAFINSLDPQMREDALDHLRIELLETQGITFAQPQHNNHGHGNNDQDEDEDRSDDEDDEDDEEDEDGENNEVTEGNTDPPIDPVPGPEGALQDETEGEHEDQGEERGDQDNNQNANVDAHSADAHFDNADLYEDPIVRSDNEDEMVPLMSEAASSEADSKDAQPTTPLGDITDTTEKKGNNNGADGLVSGLATGSDNLVMW